MLLVAGIIAAALLSLYFSSLTYALRNFSRARLEDLLSVRGKLESLEGVVDYRADLVFVTAFVRMLANILIVVASVRLLDVAGVDGGGGIAMATARTAQQALDSPRCARS